MTLSVLRRSISYGAPPMMRYDFMLTPGRYVGAAEGASDGEGLAEKMARLTRVGVEQFAESDRLEGEIKRNLAGLGWLL